MVFIHGYNVSFEEAALRAAQLGYDLGIAGVMAFYSWPSQGTLQGYAADAASIEASEAFISDFLTRMATTSGVARVHIIAHSMGNRGYCGPLIGLRQQPRERRRSRSIRSSSPQLMWTATRLLG